MSDNLRRYRAIRDTLLQWYPATLNGHQRRHVITLAGLISGIVGGQHTHLDKVAARVPGTAKPTSRSKQFTRWVANDAITPAVYYLPFAELLLASLAHCPLVLILDGSTVGRGCIALLISVAYRGRALPIAWIVAKGRKGHFAETVHLQLVEQLVPLLPPDASVVVLGDGEFDGLTFQQTLHMHGWTYVSRTACNLPIRVGIETFFSDQKSRGFHIHKSHISNPQRLLRLLIAACLAYLWIVYLGTLARVEGWVAIIHRTDRCDLSLFQLGLRLLEHFMNEGMPIPVAFTVLLLD